MNDETKKFWMRAVLLALTLALGSVASEARADQAAEICDRDAHWAGSLENATVVAVAERTAFDDQRKEDADGSWNYSWKATYRIHEVLSGSLGDDALTLEGGCSGMPNMSFNHCARPPEGKSVALFLGKRDGRWVLVERFPAAPCPSSGEVDAAKKKHPKVFADLDAALQRHQAGAEPRDDEGAGEPSSPPRDGTASAPGEQAPTAQPTAEPTATNGYGAQPIAGGPSRAGGSAACGCVAPGTPSLGSAWLGLFLLTGVALRLRGGSRSGGGTPERR